MKLTCSHRKLIKQTPRTLGVLFLFIAILWATISTLYLLAGLLVVLHSEPGTIDIFERFKLLDYISAIATTASAAAAFMSYRASVNASEIASRVGLMDRRIENYRAFLALKHHMIENQHSASEAEVSKYYYHSIDAKFLFPEELSSKIADYYDACFNAAQNHTLHKQASNQTDQGKIAITTANTLSTEIEKEILDILR